MDQTWFKQGDRELQKFAYKNRVAYSEKEKERHGLIADTLFFR